MRPRQAPDARLDPVYYLRRYPDLASFTTADQAIRHYDRHGAAEGRYPNARVEEEAEYARYLIRSADFDLVAYRALNPDLERIFSTDRDFIFHYIRHGRAEGRPATFSRGTGDPLAPAWTKLFSASQFSAWASAWKDPPASREEALTLFRDWGLEKLAPIRFDYRFDPEFYRRRYRISASVSDVEMYRGWLDDGVPAHRPPNETRLLLPYLDEHPFPDSFDWRGYAAAAGLKGEHDRADALIHLFDKDVSCLRVARFVRPDDHLRDLIALIAGYRLRCDRHADALAALRTIEQDDSAWPARLHRLRGDALLAAGKATQAGDAFALASAKGDDSAETAIRAATAAIAAKAFDQAVQRLSAQPTHAERSRAFEQVVDLLIERLFIQTSTEAHAALAAQPPSIAQANDGMRRGLERIATLIETLDLAPAPLGRDPSGPVILLGNETIRQCTHYRIEQKQMQFRAAGLDLRRYADTEVDRFIAALPGACAAIFYRVPATPSIMRAILTARRMGIPTYYDIDDLIFCAESYPPPLSTYGGQITEITHRGLQFGVPLFRFAIELCDRAIASTPALLAHMEPLVRERRGMLLRNGLDDRNRAMAMLGAKRAPGREGRIRIFYGSGTLAHHADFIELVAPALRRLLDEQPNVDLVFVGHVPQAAILAGHADRTLRYPVIAEIEDYWSILAYCDINIAMLQPDAVADCKSEIKWLEAALLGIPTVASGTATYRDAIADSIDGAIADTPQQWYDALSRLAADVELRASMGQAAHRKANDRYALTQAAATWREEFRTLPPARPKERLRVLVCNVFFHPQSLGGATRVVEDNVAAIADACPDIELAIFCSDDSATPGALRTSRFGNVPVFRFTATNDPRTDLMPFDPASAAAFETALDRFQPDLVHFHCVQRLTASIVQTCLDRAIPYIVTLHDAWWISPHQFLVDEDGFLRLPDPDPLGMAARAPSNLEAEVHRRTRLRGLLLGAECLLTVSPGFATLHRAAGLDATTVANGLPALPPPFHTAPQGGPLRLAHIGGRASHKGADLIEATLRYNAFPHLSLLMIDGRLAPGERIDTHWGESAVTLCGPFAQRDVGQLYSQMDVLLAPSRWPESYGLVAREAAHFGLWVVAPGIGAMGEDLIEGENGFRIDTEGRAPLDRLLARFNAEPDRYRQGSARSAGIQRSVTDQAEELADIYRQIAGRRRSVKT